MISDKITDIILRIQSNMHNEIDSIIKQLNKQLTEIDERLKKLENKIDTTTIE